jgi:drug/metabolite transporter (DMT)-like permease
MVLVAATLFGINGTVSKVALSSGLSSLRLTEARSAGACFGLVLIALLRKPSSLRVARREVPRLAIFGCIGVASSRSTRARSGTSTCGVASGRLSACRSPA